MPINISMGHLKFKQFCQESSKKLSKDLEKSENSDILEEEDMEEEVAANNAGSGAVAGLSEPIVVRKRKRLKDF